MAPSHALAFREGRSEASTGVHVGRARKELADELHAAIIKPKLLLAAVRGGFTLDDCIIDEAAGTASRPKGLTRPITASRAVTFGAGCTGCPLRAQCTTSKKGRTLTVHQHEALLRAARREAPGSVHSRDAED